MLSVIAQGTNSPLHTPPATHRLGAFWAKYCSCIFAINGPKQIHPVWTVFWNQLPVGPTLQPLAASSVTSLYVVWKHTSPSLKLPDASIWSSPFPYNEQWPFPIQLLLASASHDLLKQFFMISTGVCNGPGCLQLLPQQTPPPHFLIPSLSIPYDLSGSCFPSCSNLQSHSFE